MTSSVQKNLVETTQPWVDSGDARWLADGWDTELDRYYYDVLKWEDTRVSWDSLNRPCSSIDLYKSNDREVSEFLGRTVLSQYENIILTYEENMPYLMVSWDVFQRNYMRFLTLAGDALGCAVQGENLFVEDFFTVFACEFTSLMITE